MRIIGAVSLAALALSATGARASDYTATQQQVDAAELLLTFTTLNKTAAGQAALDANLATSIYINNSANSARRTRALNDILIDGTYGWQFTSGLGSKISQAYNGLYNIDDSPAGVPATPKGSSSIPANDPRFAAVAQGFSGFTGVTGGASAFDKTFFANGKQGNVNPVTNIPLPAGGTFNTYDQRYLPVPGGTVYPLNPNGNSRPYQVRPNQIDQFAIQYNSQLTTNSAFPSGHTTYGTTEALLEAMAVPEAYSSAIARGLDYGYSRVVVGAHYVMDVIGGRILATQQVAQIMNDNPNYTTANASSTVFASFSSAFRSLISQACGQSVAACAGLIGAPSQQRYADYKTGLATANYRMTYGLPATGDTTRAAVVPQGAEVLLATRFGYLSAAERRSVLATTEIASGQALDNGSGWARLNLYKAGGGYGAFDHAVVINQDASQGGFSAYDEYMNDIGGLGSLTHEGTGTLALYGANSYSGGTTVDGGTLIALSNTALGTGDVTIAGGILDVRSALGVHGAFSETAGFLDLHQGDLLTLFGSALLGGGLNVDLDGASQGLLELIAFDGGYTGEFANVDFTGLGRGLDASLVYQNGGLFAQIGSAAPEPSEWALMIVGAGLAGVALRRARRRAAAAA